MVFTDIRLQNFRSYSDASFELDPGVTIIIGPNAAGKTNLLEAIMLGATGRSYRVEDELIGHDQDWARIDIHTSDNNEITIKITEDKKQVEIDQKLYTRLPVQQKQPVVFFEPNHLLLLHGEPHNRRSYLDDLLEQSTLGYTKLRSDYKRILAQRNRLLKQNPADKSQFFVWNVRLSEAADKIVSHRTELTSEINKTITSVYTQTANDVSSLKLNYSSIVPLKNYSTSLLKKLESSLETDLMRGHTSSGPHRDDFVCYLRDHRADTTASRGEIRTIILALKVVELNLLEASTGVRPILLLDDVFSELDGARRKALVGFLQGNQTIITTTDADIVTKNFSQNCHIIPLG